MEKILRDGLAALGLSPSEEAVQSLCRYGALLLGKNAVTNLTAIRDEAGVARLHFLDCAALLTLADFAGRRVLDVGSGAGFPGVPLGVLRPDIRLTMVDSVKKKMDFVSEACGALGLENVTCLWGRVEELPQLRESFDIVVSRAVSQIDELAELCIPQIAVGGFFIAMKGPDCEEEVSRGEFAVKTMGGRVREICRYDIPGTDVTHAAVVVEKIKPTPPQYPRRWVQIRKKPLRG